MSSTGHAAASELSFPSLEPLDHLRDLQPQVKQPTVTFHPAAETARAHLIKSSMDAVPEESDGRADTASSRYAPREGAGAWGTPSSVMATGVQAAVPLTLPAQYSSRGQRDGAARPPLPALVPPPSHVGRNSTRHEWCLEAMMNMKEGQPLDLLDIDEDDPLDLVDILEAVEGPPSAPSLVASSISLSSASSSSSGERWSGERG